jgi:hypothetical protein
MASCGQVNGSPDTRPSLAAYQPPQETSAGRLLHAERRPTYNPPMTTTRLFVPQWTRDDADQHGLAISGILVYCDRARRRGLSNDEIAEDLEAQWPGIVPDGCAVRTGSDGVIWVASGAFIRGECRSGRSRGRRSRSESLNSPWHGLGQPKSLTELAAPCRMLPNCWQRHAGLASNRALQSWRPT